jgi:transcriptional regulator with XRE-family HTH domain
VITPLQVKLARAALGWSLRDLARAADISPTTVTRFELGRGGLHSTNLVRLQATLEGEGVLFVPADETGEATIRVRRR